MANDEGETIYEDNDTIIKKYKKSVSSSSSELGLFGWLIYIFAYFFALAFPGAALGLAIVRLFGISENQILSTVIIYPLMLSLPIYFGYQYLK